MFKKLLIAVILLAVVVGISYVKMVRADKRQAEAFEQGIQSGEEELFTAQQRLDSLRMILAEREVEVGSTLTASDAAHRLETDSLSLTITGLEEKIRGLEVDLARARTASKKSSSQTSQKKPSRHEQVLSFYKQRYKGLPQDLSSYEQKVALGEIRQETAKKFSITVAELNRIRSEHELTY